MNNLLHLKDQFNQRKHPGGFGTSSLPMGQKVTANHMQDLMNQLQRVLSVWQGDKTINGALVSVYYSQVVAKSNRIKGLLCTGSTGANDSVRGSRFSDDPIKHIFTHYVQLDVLKESISRLEICIDIMNRKFSGEISYKDIFEISKNKKSHGSSKISKTNFLNVIVDSHYVDMFTIDRDVELIKDQSIVTIYRTDIKTSTLLERLGIDMIDAKVIDETTLRLDPDELKILIDKAPYLVSMSVRDIRDITLDDISVCDENIISIPSPENEPIIGVVDTLFFEDVYFKEWVTYTRELDENIATNTQDCRHGTAVSSLIVDGPTINPDLDDGCGRFRVRHFGVAPKDKFSSFSIIKNIRRIVAQNRDIKVWNLSLGSFMEINRNFISPEAAELDKIQCEYDIVFVVAGTNKPPGSNQKMLIGAPADSINSIVVNAVSFSGKPVSYHRTGPVLSFFHKPDISYYGGDVDQKLRVCTPFGEELVSGTSYAAPWISRKMAYLIHKMGFTREIAKALLVDSAAGWDRKDGASLSIGYGVVPKRIEEIIQTSSDEIRFIMTGSADSYETYYYNIPVPIHKDKQPFYARATLCYFPNCAREQGVDYTSTEMDIHFGRIKVKEGKSEVNSINQNTQGDDGFNPIREESARRFYRKWDNIKHINDIIKHIVKPRKVYGAGLWGLNIKIKERLRSNSGRGMQFGVVVTLKEMYGENRIDEFIKLCLVRGLIVNQIDVQNRFDIYAKAEEDIVFE